jgi:hypothetical protein
MADLTIKVAPPFTRFLAGGWNALAFVETVFFHFFSRFAAM